MMEFNMNGDLKEFLWTQRYRPKTVADCILPDDLKKTFQTFVKNGEIPNLLLAGGPGIGKTTVAMAMLEELGRDYIVINGSMNGNIDTLRTEIQSFASTMSFHGGRKYVILDEADYLNPNSTQPALRNFMEEFSKNCGFIFTCNYLNRIIEPLHSRCSIIEFKIGKKEKQQIAVQFLKRVVEVLDTEKVPYEKPVVSELIVKHFGDWRRVLNELQRYSASGKIDSGIFANISDDSVKTLIDFMRGKDYKNMRKWVAENSDTDTSAFIRRLYDVMVTTVSPNNLPDIVLIVARYQYQSVHAVDQEINTLAMCTELMGLV
jgi:DNA polymerase III delta prime subunit